ncbi:MAG: sigma-54 dependent transcriptional regulator [Acidobacteriota bacterium]|nr:sigma-54 dependent transcriptional regulator [Acidobacteriota bacterium]
MTEAEVLIAAETEVAAEFCRTREISLLFAHFSARGSALECLERLHQGSPGVPIFIRDRQATASDTLPLAQLGLRRIFDAGAEADYVVNEVALALEQAAENRRKREFRPEVRPSWQCGLIGESGSMRQTCEIIRLVAGRRSTVLISGETGTGKEVVARAIHMASPRAGLPFVAVNCSAIPESLLEAELFGHVRGAFTGAQQMRAGRFEQANRSTLFLDEIGDMPLELQAKLLRVLQEREFQRLGSSETIKVDVRIIAASNLNLLDRVREGLFREDLYYRLNVVPLPLPPLRARLEDVPELAEYFVTKICRDEGITRKTLSASALSKLSLYTWPGNVRQLENAIEMAVVMSGPRTFLAGVDFHLPPGDMQAALPAGVQSVPLPDHGLDFEKTVSQFEMTILSQALRRTGGNKKLAADMLRLKRTTLSAKVRTLESAIGCSLV